MKIWVTINWLVWELLSPLANDQPCLRLEWTQSEAAQEEIDKGGGHSISSSGSRKVVGVDFLMVEEIRLSSQFLLCVPTHPCFFPLTSSPNASFLKGCPSTITCFQATGMFPKNERFQRHHCIPESHCAELGFGGLLWSYVHKVTCRPCHIWTSLPVQLTLLLLGGRFTLSFCKGQNFFFCLPSKGRFLLTVYLFKSVHDSDNLVSFFQVTCLCSFCFLTHPFPNGVRHFFDK